MLLISDFISVQNRSVQPFILFFVSGKAHLYLVAIMAWLHYQEYPLFDPLSICHLNYGESNHLCRTGSIAIVSFSPVLLKAGCESHWLIMHVYISLKTFNICRAAIMKNKHYNDFDNNKIACGKSKAMRRSNGSKLGLYANQCIRTLAMAANYNAQ